MKNALYQFCLLLALCGTLPATAQTPPAVLTFSTPDALWLRWRPVTSADLETYAVYRRETPAGDWRRLPERPLPFLQTNSELRAVLRGETGFFLALFGIDDPAQDLTPAYLRTFYQNADAVAFLEVMSLVNAKYGEALGVVFKDSEVDAGKSYEYRIAAIQVGQERSLASTGALLAGASSSIPRPSTLQARGADQRVDLSWKKEQALLKKGEVVSWRVYRSEQLSGGYEPLNATGVLPIRVSSGDKPAAAPDTEQFVDLLVENGRRYYYYICAVNAFGLESEPSPVVEAVPADEDQPAPPTGLNAISFGSAARLAWNLPDKGVGLKGVEIFKAAQRSGPFRQVYPSSALLLRKDSAWIDLEVEEGGDYFYYAQSVGENSQRSQPSDTLHFFYPDATPPQPPQQLQAKPEPGRIVLRWLPNTEKDLLGYAVERSSDERFQTRFLLTSNPITTATFADTLPPGAQTTFGYVVYALDRYGNRSAPSQLVKARLPDKTAPQTPFITSLEKDKTKFTLRWTKSPEPDATRYRVYRASANGQTWTRVGEVAETVFQDKLLAEGNYLFAVSAVDASGNESPRSEPFSLAVQNLGPPPAPASGKISVENNNLILTWEPSKSARLETYTIYRIDRQRNQTILLAQLKANETRYVDKRALPNRAYTYQIVAMDNRGLKSEALVLEYVPEGD